MTDVELKNRGNKFFAARKYEEAIKCYSDAIVSCNVYKLKQTCRSNKITSNCFELLSNYVNYPMQL